MSERPDKLDQHPFPPMEWDDCDWWDGEIDLALLTDGLRAEREQGITIDVAYKYFSTPKRKFIIADAPGHIQYTRNMVTGASNSDLAIILIDARHGVVEQTRRHSIIASLLNIPRVIVAVNNAGGGIFSFLPIAAHTDIFEPFWGTPHNADFKAGAAFAGLHYALAEKIQDFRTAYTSALQRAQKENTSTLLEVRTGRTENFDEHKRLQALITSRLQGYAA